MTKAHRARLQAAAARPLPRAAGRVAILTGQSRLDQSPLSPAQAAFLRAVTPPGWQALAVGFPFADEAPAPPAPFAQAAANSIRQYLWARTSAAYGRAAGDALARVMQASDRLALITGSAGLAILNAAEPHLLPHPALTVIALGPAGRAPRLACRFRVIRAEGDLWARLLGPAAETVIPGDHYGYWTSPAARAAVCDGLRPA